MAEVESAELGDDFLDHSVDLFLVGAVGLDRDDLAARLFSKFSSRLLGRLDVEVDDCDICASFSECRSRALADAASCARDETFFASQCHFFKYTHDKTSFLFSYFVKSFFKSVYIIIACRPIVKRKIEKNIKNTGQIPVDLAGTP